MSEYREKPAAPAPAGNAKNDREGSGGEPGPEEFGKSFATNSGLANSTGVARKDTADAATDSHGIAGGPETGAAAVTKP